MEFQVTGEPVTGELSATNKEKSYLFLSLSLLLAVWYEQNNVLFLVFVQSNSDLLLLAASAERLFWSLE